MEGQWTAEEFKNPPEWFRGAPFWAWNNKLDLEELKEQIKYFKEMGMGGYHIHCRVGLDTPYLGEDFLNCVSECAAEGRRLGLYTYLYDEDRWPSGAAGGLVTREKAYRSRHLLFSPRKEALSAGERTLLASYEIQLEDGCLKRYIRKEAEGFSEETPDADVWDLYLEIAAPDPWYNNQTYLDTLNKKAVERFIEVTHETYYELLGEEFGKTIPSIFTDEPQFERKQTLDFAGEQKALKLPYTDCFEEFYRERFGEEFLDHFPELVWELPDGRISAARYQYHEGIAELFSRSFADTIGSWCERHHLMLTGHMMEEPTLLSQTSALGEAMRSYRSFQQPGIDMLCDWREYTTAKQAQSAAHQYGCPGVLSELYGVTNWDFDFRGHKLQGDWQAALGVTRRVHHLSWTSMQGEAKRDYPASIFYQSPWYKEYKMVEDHFARVNTALMRGTPHVRVGVIHPVESYWLHFGPKEQTAQVRENLERQFRSLTEWLLFGTIDFDFLAESLLQTQEVSVKDAKLCVGKMQYDVVLVPGCETMRRSTLNHLIRFREAGGSVIFAGNTPKYLDAKPDVSAQVFAEQCMTVPMNQNDILDILKPFREIEIRRSDGKLADHFLYQMREEGNGRWLFLANGKKPENPDIPQSILYRIRIAGQWKAELCDTQSGDIELCHADIADGWTTIRRIIDLHDSLLVHLTPQDGDAGAKTGPQTAKVQHQQILRDDAAAGQERVIALQRPEQELPQPDQFELDEPNVLLLDQCAYCFDHEEWQGPEEILRIDNRLRERLGFAKRMEAWPQPWVQKEENDKKHVLTLKFDIFSEITCDKAILALENPAAADIVWNGTPVKKEYCGWYVDKSLKKVPLGSVNKGKNTLSVTLPFGKKTNLEWMYLLGDFGVRTAGRSAWLTKKPEKLCFGDYTVQGLPFYAGNVKYSLFADVKEEGTYGIQISKYRAPLLKVAVDGGEWKKIAYAPYEAALGFLSKGSHRVDIVTFGNRVNAFGAVHNCDEGTEWFGPNAWRTEGCGYSYEYQLKRMGILKTPTLFKINQ